MGLNIKQLRKEKNVNQETLAEMLDVTSQAFSRYERGERELGYAALMKLANYFDVSVDYLLGNSTYFYPDAVKKIAPELSDEESELLALFGKMSPAQKARFVGYGEGLLNERKEMADKAFK